MIDTKCSKYYKLLSTIKTYLCENCNILNNINKKITGINMFNDKRLLFL